MRLCLLWDALMVVGAWSAPRFVTSEVREREVRPGVCLFEGFQQIELSVSLLCQFRSSGKQTAGRIRSASDLLQKCYEKLGGRGQGKGEFVQTAQVWHLWREREIRNTFIYKNTLLFNIQYTILNTIYTSYCVVLCTTLSVRTLEIPGCRSIWSRPPCALLFHRSEQATWTQGGPSPRGFHAWANHLPLLSAKRTWLIICFSGDVDLTLQLYQIKNIFDWINSVLLWQERCWFC